MDKLSKYVTSAAAALAIGCSSPQKQVEYVPFTFLGMDSKVEVTSGNGSLSGLNVWGMLPGEKYRSYIVIFPDKFQRDSVYNEIAHRRVRQLQLDTAQVDNTQAKSGLTIDGILKSSAVRIPTQIHERKPSKRELDDDDLVV